MEFSITVAIPFFNDEKYLANCVRSVLNQSYPANEIIIVNDRSENKPVLKKCSKITIINHAENRGLAAARNSALYAAKGNFIFYFDCDTVPEKNYLETAVWLVKKYNLDGIGGRGVEKTLTINDKWRANYWKQDFGNKEILFAWRLNGLCSAYKVSSLKNVGGFNVFFKRCGEDVDIGIRLNKKGYKLMYSPDLIVHHHRRDDFESLKNMVKNHLYYGLYALKINAVSTKTPCRSLRMEAIGKCFTALFSRKDPALFRISIILFFVIIREINFFNKKFFGEEKNENQDFQAN